MKREREVCKTIADPFNGQQRQECHKETVETYELQPLEAVLAGLAFTADQIQQVHAMLGDAGGLIPAIPGAPALDPSIGDCYNFVPNQASRYLWPASGPITSCFGGRTDPVVGGAGFHTGIDVGAGMGAPVRAAQAGTVTKAEWYGNYGNVIVITGADLQTYYGRLNGYAVSSGQTIRKGDVIGYVGSTGKSTGPHLHFETRPGGGAPVDPRRYFQ